MLQVSENFKSATASLVRNPRVKVEKGSNTYTQDDAIKSVEIQRIGDESKFFGYGICHRLNIKSIQISDESNFSTGNNLSVYLGFEMADGSTEYIKYPTFTVTEVNKDVDAGELSVTAYDTLDSATKYTVGELTLEAPYTVKQFLAACATLLGLEYALVNIAEDDINLNLSFSEGANFSGTETIRDALNAVAEVLQAVYYLNNENKLIFKRLDRDGDPEVTLTVSDYFTLNCKTNRRLATLCHATELGDNVSESTTEAGSTQYIRENPFWDLRDDVGTLLHDAFVNTNGLTINQFDSEWKGNLALEVGDKIKLTDRLMNNSFYSYLLNDTITFDGSLRQNSEWNYSASESETESNPTSLGEVLKQTYARVDKANQTVELMVSKTEENTESIASLLLNTESITASVQRIEDENEINRSELEEELAVLSSKVNASVTSEDVQLEIQKQLTDGIDKVTTSTGFTFNDEGLTVSKSNSEMKTTITEDGMTVYKNDEAVLTANNIGVDAVNLHATTYLIIGTNSRFEDYDGNRTGCFWIGS